MAFKRSGVRLPLAPPIYKTIFNLLRCGKLVGGFKQKHIRSYKGFAYGPSKGPKPHPVILVPRARGVVVQRTSAGFSIFIFL